MAGLRLKPGLPITVGACHLVEMVDDPARPLQRREYGSGRHRSAERPELRLVAASGPLILRLGEWRHKHRRKGLSEKPLSGRAMPEPFRGGWCYCWQYPR